MTGYERVNSKIGREHGVRPETLLQKAKAIMVQMSRELPDHLNGALRANLTTSSFKLVLQDPERVGLAGQLRVARGVVRMLGGNS